MALRGCTRKLSGLLQVHSRCVKKMHLKTQPTFTGNKIILEPSSEEKLLNIKSKIRLRPQLYLVFLEKAFSVYFLAYLSCSISWSRGRCKFILYQGNEKCSSHFSMRVTSAYQFGCTYEGLYSCTYIFFCLRIDHIGILRIKLELSCTRGLSVSIFSYIFFNIFLSKSLHCRLDPVHYQEV